MGTRVVFHPARGDGVFWDTVAILNSSISMPTGTWFTKAMAYVSIFYAVVMFGARKQSEFIYFQF